MSARFGVVGAVVVVGMLGLGVPVAQSAEQGYADAVLADQPVVYWRLGEAPGSAAAADASGNGRTGQFSNVELGVPGALRADPDTAARLVQFSGVVGAPDGPAFEPMAVELWVRTTATDQRVISGGADATDGWSVSVGADGRVRAEVHQWNRFRRTTTGPETDVRDGAWHHVVANLNDAGSQVFVDSVAGTTAPVTVSAVVCDPHSACAYPDDPPFLIAGRAAADLDEVAVYAAPLAADRIALHHQLGVEEPQDPGPGEPPLDTEDEPIEAPDPDPVDSDDPDSPNEGATGFAATATTPAVTWSSNPDMIKFRNADGIWTIYRRCFDRVSGGLRYTVGPGYIARLNRGGTLLVNDFRGRTNSGTPGYLNEVNGGLGTFGLHYARGIPGQVQAGDDPTTAGTTELPTGRDVPVIEGRMCPSKNQGAGVYRVGFFGPSRISSTNVQFTVDVWLRDQYGATGAGPSGNALLKVRYRYSFFRSSVKAWMSVTTYAKPNAAGTPFVKEPKFTALTGSAGQFSRISVFKGATGTEFLKGVTFGEPSDVKVLNTDHSADPARNRVRWDHGTSESDEQPGTACDRVCFNVVARAYDAPGGDVLRGQPTFAWEGSGRGLDLWAVRSDARAKAYPRDTYGDDQVNTCSITPDVDGDGDPDDIDGDGDFDDVDRSIYSQQASPSKDGVRRWEHGGFKAGALYRDSFSFFTGWEGARGPYDCEPLQRAFGPQGESYGAFASYSVNDGWALS